MTNQWEVRMLNAPCDRCGKVAEECRPFKLTESITFRGKQIDMPWLCRRCFVKEKEKFWSARRTAV